MDDTTMGDEWTQLPVERLKEETVIRLADDLGLPSQEILAVVVVKKKWRFIAAAPKDVTVQYCPAKGDYTNYEAARKDEGKIIEHVVREIQESIKEKRPYLTIYYTPNPCRLCETDPETGHREVFLS